MRPGNPRRPLNCNETDSIENLSLPAVPGSGYPLRKASSLVLPNWTNTSSRDYKLLVERSTSSEDRNRKPNAKITLPNKNIQAFEAKISVIGRQICYHTKDKTIYLPNLRGDEKQFIKLVEEDRVEDVQEFVKNHPDLNINCTNYQGITALHVALRNKSDDMVKALLCLPSIELGDAVLTVLNNKNVNKDLLLHLLDAQKRISPGLEFAGVVHSTLFSEHDTPLTVAARAGDYDVVGALLGRGHRLAPPHAAACACLDCINPSKEDTLYRSNAKLAVYQAMASPAVMVHAARDPLHSAFLLSAELRECASLDYHLAATYLALRRSVRTFAVELIDCCRTSDEVQVILKQNSDTWTRSQFVLPRLMMAIDYRQKEFVAHRNTQEVLQCHWLGDLQSWNNKSLASKAFIIVSRVFTTPLMLILSLVYPCHRLLQKWQIPLNKLITHVSAYFVFLGIVFYISNQDRRKQRRGPPNTGAEGPLVLYVAGYAWSALRQCARVGPRRHLRDLWNWVELVMLLLFVVTFYLWFCAAVAVADGGGDDIERKYWNPHDPTLLAEGTFCVATIIAYFRLMYLCQLNCQLGPLQVSLGKMIVDIYEYVIIFAIIITAFSAGLARLYQYYDGMVYEDQFGMKTVQVSSFTGIRDTLNTLFWALFCMAPLESADVVMAARNCSGAGRGRCVHHSYTERVGYFCFGCFEVISVIIVLNMLIATMSNTFQKVTGNAAIEWTFAKTQVYVHYMSLSTLPPPYNLVPTPHSVAAAFRWLFSKETNVPDMEASVDREFPVIMSVVVQRYFRRQRESDHREPSERARHVTAAVIDKEDGPKPESKCECNA